MANISKIVVKIVADTGAFTSVIATETKKAESYLTRLARMRFAPSVRGNEARQPEGDSLTAAKDLVRQAQKAWATFRRIREEMRNPKTYMNFGSLTEDFVSLRDRHAQRQNAADKALIVLGKAWLNTPINTWRNFYKMVTAPIRATVWLSTTAARVALNAVRATAARIMSSLVTPAVLSGMFMLGLSVYQFERYTIGVANAAMEQDLFAAAIGSSSLAVRSFAGQMKALGEDAETVYRVLHAVESLKLASAFGDRAALAVYKDLGLLADKVSRDPLTGFNTIAVAIDRQESDLQKLAMAYRVFGADAAKAMKVVGKDPTGAGGLGANSALAFDAKALASYHQAQQNLTQLGVRFDAFMGTVLNRFAPTLLVLFDAIDRAVSGIDFSTVFGDGVRAAGYLIQLFSNLPTYIRIAWNEMKVFGAEIMSFFNDVRGMALIVAGWMNSEGGAALSAEGWKVIGDSKYKKMGDDAKARIAELEKTLTTGAQSLEIASALVAKAVAGQNTRDLWARYAGMLKMYEPLFAKGKQYAREATNPFETFKTDTRQLKWMLDNKAIDKQTFGRTLNKMIGDAESNLNVVDLRLPTSARKDSAEAVSAVNRSDIEFRMKVAMTPIERLQRVAETGNVILGLIRENTEKTADAVKRNPALVEFRE